MSMGQGPWTFGDPKLERVMLSAAQLHSRLQPYIYSQAIRFYLDGYPWTMAPLPVAFPDEPGAYGRENDAVRGYEWMIGDALLAAPLYGNDYETAATRDIYLPAGDWIDYDSSEKYQGPRTLKNFALPPGKTPLFIGGSGVLIEQQSKQTVACIYPISKNSNTTFYDRDGVTKTTVHLAVSDWKPITVRSKSGHPVTGVWKGNAFEFPISPGEEYEIR
jgi:alpha-glucosidase (family GH31 glycosyl hydrolase)